MKYDRSLKCKTIVQLNELHVKKDLRPNKKIGVFGRTEMRVDNLG